MKLLSALALTTLLGTSAAFAAQPAGTAPGATPPASTPSASSSTPETAAPAKAAPSKSTKTSKVASACMKQANNKHLKGADRKSFMKDCKAGKSTG